MPGPLIFLFFFVAALVLIGVAAWLVRRFATNRLGANTQRGRMPRLAVIDAAAVDGRRRLVLVRRDNVEHLLMIGGPSDIVVEPNIVRAVAAREQLPQRAGVAPEPPPRIAPLPDVVGWADTEAAREEHAEPPMPEPPPRPVRPSFADELRRPAAMPMDRRVELGGFPTEPMGGRPEPREPRLEPRPELRPEPRPEPIPQRIARTEPMMPRPLRPAEPPKTPPLRASERAAAPPPPSPPPPPAPPSNADQNLAEMAQRLEAALRRPAADTQAPPVAPEPPGAGRVSRAEPQPPPPPAKTGFENLEDEMASLLGRPKPSSSSS